MCRSYGTLPCKSGIEIQFVLRACTRAVGSAHIVGMDFNPSSNPQRLSFRRNIRSSELIV